MPASEAPSSGRFDNMRYGNNLASATTDVDDWEYALRCCLVSHLARSGGLLGCNFVICVESGPQSLSKDMWPFVVH